MHKKDKTMSTRMDDCIDRLARELVAKELLPVMNKVVDLLCGMYIDEVKAKQYIIDVATMFNTDSKCPQPNK